jgi:ABC-type bacteriocin/lantibiotic exporter with double-glycine peptidase domain
MFTLFCIVLAFPPIAILILSICIFRLYRTTEGLWKEWDEQNECIANICEGLDDLEESVDDILAYLEDGGEKK